MQKLIYVLLAGLMLTTSSSAQVSPDEVDLVYSNQNYGGLTLHSNGWGLFYNRGKYKGFQNLITYGLDVGNLKHEKEVRAYYPNPPRSTAGSYFYGKMNSIILVRPHVGKRHFITQKQRANGVEVGYTWEIGPSIALAKPVYLEIGYPTPEINYSTIERYDPDKHNTSNILGKASSLRGLNEIKPYFGGHFKFSLLFEYSNAKDRVKGVEAGAALDIYPLKIPILAESAEGLDVDNNRAIFPTFFVNFFFGRKYNNR